MQIELFVGPESAQDGIGNVKARAGRQGDLIVSELHGRYYEQAFRGNMYVLASRRLSLVWRFLTLLAPASTPWLINSLRLNSLSVLPVLSVS